MATLDADTITALLASKRDRGGYARFLDRNSDEAYILLNEVPEYAAKIADGKGPSVKVGLESNGEKAGMRVKVIETDGEWIYVNLDIHEAALTQD